MKLREFTTTFDGEEVRVTLPESLAQRVEDGDVITIRVQAAQARADAPRTPAARPRRPVPSPWN